MRGKTWKSKMSGINCAEITHENGQKFKNQEIVRNKKNTQNEDNSLVSNEFSGQIIFSPAEGHHGRVGLLQASAVNEVEASRAKDVVALFAAPAGRQTWGFMYFQTISYS